MSGTGDDLPEQGAETYLGDGLYVSFDGWQITLRAPRGPGGGDHFVALEPSTYKSLQEWITRFPRLAKHLGSGK